VNRQAPPESPCYILDLSVNGAFHETLIALDDNACELNYRIDDGPGRSRRAK